MICYSENFNDNDCPVYQIDDGKRRKLMVTGDFCSSKLKDPEVLIFPDEFQLKQDILLEFVDKRSHKAKARRKVPVSLPEKMLRCYRVTIGVGAEVVRWPETLVAAKIYSGRMWSSYPATLTGKPQDKMYIRSGDMRGGRIDIQTRADEVVLDPMTPEDRQYLHVLSSRDGTQSIGWVGRESNCEYCSQVTFVESVTKKITLNMPVNTLIFDGMSELLEVAGDITAEAVTFLHTPHAKITGRLIKRPSQLLIHSSPAAMSQLMNQQLLQPS